MRRLNFKIWIKMGIFTMLIACSPVENAKTITMNGNDNNIAPNDTVAVDSNSGFACNLNSGKCSIPSDFKDTAATSISNIKNGKLIYVGDPICSSCFAFAPEIMKVKKEFEGELDFQLVLGGLRPFGTEPITTEKDYLQPHFDNLARMTGLPINSGILGDSTFILDTEPPSRAVVVVRELAPELEIEFYERVQRAFYLDNNNTNYAETYLGFIADFGIDKAVFKKRFESQDLKEQVKSDFKLANDMGVRAFPTLLLESNGQISTISVGYAESALLIKKIRSLLSVELIVD